MAFPSSDPTPCADLHLDDEPCSLCQPWTLPSWLQGFDPQSPSPFHDFPSYESPYLTLLPQSDLPKDLLATVPAQRITKTQREEALQKRNDYLEEQRDESRRTRDMAHDIKDVQQDRLRGPEDGPSHEVFMKTFWHFSPHWREDPLARLEREHHESLLNWRREALERGEGDLMENRLKERLKSQGPNSALARDYDCTLESYFQSGKAAVDAHRQALTIRLSDVRRAQQMKRLGEQSVQQRQQNEQKNHTQRQHDTIRMPPPTTRPSQRSRQPPQSRTMHAPSPLIPSLPVLYGYGGPRAGQAVQRPSNALATKPPAPSNGYVTSLAFPESQTPLFPRTNGVTSFGIAEDEEVEAERPSKRRLLSPDNSVLQERAYSAGDRKQPNGFAGRDHANGDGPNKAFHDVPASSLPAHAPKDPARPQPGQHPRQTPRPAQEQEQENTVSLARAPAKFYRGGKECAPPARGQGRGRAGARARGTGQGRRNDLRDKHLQQNGREV